MFRLRERKILSSGQIHLYDYDSHDTMILYIIQYCTYIIIILYETSGVSHNMLYLNTILIFDCKHVKTY